MNATRALAIGAALLLMAPAAQSQERAGYREFRLGADLTSVAALAKLPASGAKTLHQRPALIQELEWRQPYVTSGSAASQKDPLQRIVFGFYDGQLFRLVIGYDRQRTNGLTDGDVIEALSAIYGVAMLQPSPSQVPGLTELQVDEWGPRIAQWGDVDYSVALHRSSFASEFRVVITSPRLEALAQAATAEAIRLDAREAPQREVERREKEAADTRSLQEKARLANKATFRP
jgi:hypothetical protein